MWALILYPILQSYLRLIPDSEGINDSHEQIRFIVKDVILTEIEISFIGKAKNITMRVNYL